MGIQVGTNPESTSTTPVVELGTVGHSGNKSYLYVQASGKVSAADAVRISGNAQAKSVTTTTATRGPVGVGVVEIAGGSYGWVQIAGPGEVNVAASCAANVPLSTTATAGRLDDADADGRVSGIELTSARGNSVGPAPCFIVPYPVIDRVT